MAVDKQGKLRIALTPTNTKVHLGEDDLSEWSDEELRRGRRADHRGSFPGPDPKVLPRALHEELTRRAFARANSIVATDVEDAVRLWGDIVRDEDADLSVRFEASKHIAFYVMGKPMERHQVEARVRVSKWEEALVGAVTGIVGEVDDEPEAEVIDVASVESESPAPQPDEFDAEQMAAHYGMLSDERLMWLLEQRGLPSTGSRPDRIGRLVDDDERAYEELGDLPAEPVEDEDELDWDSVQ